MGLVEMFASNIFIQISNKYIDMFLLFSCFTDYQQSLFQLTSGPQDKQDLLRQFVNNKENLEAVEMELVVTRTQEGEVEHQRSLLTIKEMKQKGFSQLLAFTLCFFITNMFELTTLLIKGFSPKMIFS